MPVTESGHFKYAFGVFNTRNLTEQFEISFVTGTDEELEPLKSTLGDACAGVRLTGRVKTAAFVDDPDAGEKVNGDPQKARLDLEIPPGSTTQHALVGAIEGGPVLLHIRQKRVTGEMIGGSSVLLVPPEFGQES